MRFFKENSYDVMRLFLNQFAFAVFGIVLVMASRMANDGQFGVLSLCAGIFSALFYMYVLYATLREMGTKHKIRVDNGRMPRDKQYGLKLMLFAQVPNFVLLFFLLLGFLLAFVFGGAPDISGGANGAAKVGVNMYTIAQLILYFLQAMYDGIIGYILPAASDARTCLGIMIAYFISVIPGILVCWGSYNMGLHDKKIIDIFKSKQKPQDGDHTDE